MAWSTPRTWSAGETLTAANFNTYIRDQQNAMGPHLIVRKTADESVTSNTTLQDDDVLALTVLANEVWQITLYLIYQAATAGDLKFAWTFPSGTLTGAYVWLDDSGGYPTNNHWNTATSPTPSFAMHGFGTEAEGPIPINMLYAVGGTGGTLRFQWAQQTSSGTATTVKANSTLWAAKLA
jgi:hypothetical protein